MPWRKPDWTESNPSVKELLDTVDADTMTDNSSPSLDIQITKHAYPSPFESLVKWYSSRVQLIEEQTAQTDIALAFCRIGVAHIPGSNVLVSLQNELITLSDLVYSCGETALDLELFRLLSYSEVLEAFLSSVRESPEVFSWRLKRFAIPYLQRCGQDITKELKDLLVSIAKTNLESVAKVFELSLTPGLPESERMLKCFSNESTAELILECAYANDRTDVPMYIYRMMLQNIIPFLTSDVQDSSALTDSSSALSSSSTASGWDDGDLEFDKFDHPSSVNTSVTSPQHRQATDLAQRISLFESHIDALDLLAKYNVPKSLQYFESEQSATQQRLLMVRMARSLHVIESGGASIASDKSDWLVLLDDLRHGARSGLFGDVGSDTVFEEVFRAALSCGREFFSLNKWFVCFFLLSHV